MTAADAEPVASLRTPMVQVGGEGSAAGREESVVDRIAHNEETDNVEETGGAPCNHCLPSSLNIAPSSLISSMCGILSQKGMFQEKC